MSTEQLDPKDTFAGMGRSYQGRKYHVHTCAVCREQFWQNRPPGNKASKTCSTVCANELRSQKMSGIAHTKEHSKRISIALTGKSYSEDRCAAMGAGRKGKHVGSDHWNWNPNRDEVLARRKSAGAMRSILRHSLEQLKQKKDRKTEELLGYTPIQLQEHLEKLFKPGMSWQNYGYGDDKWHVDHIKPVSVWDPSSHPRDVNALSNLQPLWQRDNFKKGKTWEGQ